MPTKIVVALLLAAAVAAGCGGESKSDKAQADVCAARDDISKQVDQLKGMTLSSATTSQVTDALQAIRDDLSKIGDAKASLSDERRSDVQAANDAFAASVRDTLRAVGTSVSLDNASTQLHAAFDQLATTYKTSFGSLDCP
jgi:hypothetical protein